MLPSEWRAHRTAPLHIAAAIAVEEAILATIAVVERSKKGRPPESADGLARTVTVRMRLCQSEADTLAGLAAQEGETVSEYIRRALDLQGR